MELLLKAGADPRICTLAADNILSLAAKCGHSDLVRWILKKNIFTSEEKALVVQRVKKSVSAEITQLISSNGVAVPPLPQEPLLKAPQLAAAKQKIGDEQRSLGRSVDGDAEDRMKEVFEMIVQLVRDGNREVLGTYLAIVRVDNHAGLIALADAVARRG